MSTAPDPKWPRLLALSVHEFRTPVTVVAGYIRMLLKDRAGAVTDQQRRLLEEAEKSCGRLSAIIAEMSDLSNLEAQTAPFNRSDVDLHAALAETIATLPDVPDREVTVTLAPSNGAGRVSADPVRLKTALTALFIALRRELVTSTELLVRERAGDHDGRPAIWIAIGDADHIDDLAAAAPEALTVFDEWRGGCGLSLAVARRVIDAHGGGIWSPGDGSRAGAVIALPRER
jgi:signal transduction histidine kinase